MPKGYTKYARSGGSAYANQQPKYVELRCMVMHQTDRALLVFDGKRQSWVPKSQVLEYEIEQGKPTTINLTQWVANRAGFI